LRWLAAAVGGGTVLYVFDYDRVLRFVDAVENAPLGAEPCAIESRELVSKV
jgi:hypothetical protein